MRPMRIELLEQQLICSVCRRFPRDPIECWKCGTLYCDGCARKVIDPDSGLTEYCETCKTAPDFVVAEAVRSLIRNSIFKCHDCKRLVNIGDRELHVRLCERRIRKCAFCQFETREQTQAAGHLTSHRSEIYKSMDKFSGSKQQNLFFTGADRRDDVEFLEPGARVVVHSLLMERRVQVWSTAISPLNSFWVRVMYSKMNNICIGVCLLEPSGVVGRSWSIQTLNGELIGPNRQPLGTSGLVIPTGYIIRIDVKPDGLLFMCESSGKQATLPFSLREDERKGLRVFSQLYERGSSIVLLTEEDARAI